MAQVYKTVFFFEITIDTPMIWCQGTPPFKNKLLKCDTSIVERVFDASLD